MPLHRYTAFVSMCLVSVQSVAADPLSQDVVAGVALANILNREFRAECALRFPDLKERVIEAYDAAPINSVVIHEYIEGREYRNPAVHSMIAGKREMTKGGQYGAAKRTDCENLQVVFSRSAREFLGEHDKADYQALLDWAANGSPPSPDQKSPIDLDTKIIAALQNKDFWDAYPREIKDRMIYNINLVRYVQRAQFVALNIKLRCDEKWADRRLEHDSAYEAWPFSSIKAITLVNGRPYDNPWVAPGARQYWLPAIFGADDKSQEAACRDLSGTLEKVARRAELKWYPVLLELLTVSP